MKKKLLALTLSIILVVLSPATVFASNTHFSDIHDEVVEEAVAETSNDALMEKDVEDSNVVSSDLTKSQSKSIVKKVKDVDVSQNMTSKMPVLYAGSSISSATSISLGSTYSGSITASNEMDFYKFTISTSGTVHLSSTANIQRVYYKLYDASGNEIWSDWPGWNSSTEQIVLNEDFCLTSGTYYLEILRYSNYYGNYSFKASFVSTGESFKESQNGSNNSLSNADSITLGKQYKGQIALNDDRDFYKFTLSSSGKINLSSTANIQRVYYKLFDASGDEIWSDWPGWNSSTEQIVMNEDIHLTSGVYYLEI